MNRKSRVHSDDKTLIKIDEANSRLVSRIINIKSVLGST